LVVDLQRQRIEQLRLEFCEEQRTLINEFDTERSLICAQHNHEVHELQDIMYAMDQSFEDRNTEARAEFQNQKDELKNKVTVRGFLRRLLRFDLIKWLSNARPYVCPFVRPQKVSSMSMKFGITACTVVQAVVKATSQSNGKGQILTPWGSETPERISMKLGIYNRVAGMTTHANPCGAATTWVVWANT